VDNDRLRKRYEREKKARLEVERVAEKRSRELFVTVKELERANRQKEYLIETQKKQERLLIEYAHGLEKMVAERTSELVNANLQLKATNEMLRNLTYLDGLTGVFNRMKLEEVISYEITQTERYRKMLVCVLLDIDLFKDINDSFGHPEGDIVLKKVASLIKSSMRLQDIFGRWGGEEFLAICPNLEVESLPIFLERLRSIVETVILPNSKCVTASFGAAIYREGDSSESFVARADAALYEAKRRGRNQFVIAP
jgi:diguanylate cyclase (GGDEF)-like protein